ncbi:MAG: TonB-dependent receptor plug domain-containing protein [Gammaproteobacteria bacterium]
MGERLIATAMVAIGMCLPAHAQDADEPIEEIIATGTRIVRSDHFQEAGHVVELDEITIDGFAELNIADVLRSSPLNSYGSFVEESGHTAQSNATFDLRGLGFERTLVLVDGMRVPGSPELTASGTNINLLPMAAVKRIDILADGASAVYGSDAMAGVANIVLHRSFEGLEISARYGNRARDGGGDEAIRVLGGTSSDRANLVFAFEYSHRDPIFDRDRSFTAAQVDDVNGDGRSDFFSETAGISYFGRTWDIFDPNTFYYESRAAADCPTTNGFRGVMYFGAFGTPDDSGCGYAFADIAANRAELEKLNGYLFGSYDVGAQTKVYGRVLVMKNESFGRYAPPAAPWPAPPADHPHNPYDTDQMIADGLITDEAMFYGYYRWENIGPRDNIVDDFQWDVAAGLKGDLNDRMNFDLYLQSGRYESDSLGQYYLYYPGLDYLVENGIDPFTQESAEIMRTEVWTDSFTEQSRAYAHLQIDAWDVFGAGDSIALVGVEYQTFDYENLYDPRSEAGEVGGAAGWSNGGDRNISTVFVEYLLPVSNSTELNLAGRYDNYSDFGGNFAPSLGIVSSLTDRLTVRARWGEGFVAPNMDHLYGPSSSGHRLVYDPVVDSDVRVEWYKYSNPALQPETSESKSIGFSWEFLDGLSVGATYYKIDIENVITWPGNQSLVWADAAGQEWEADGTRVERVGNLIREIHRFGENSDRSEASGVDYFVNADFDTRIGRFGVDALYSKQLSSKRNAFYRGSYQDVTKFHGNPDTRAQLGVNWSLGDHSVSLVASYIGPHSTDEERDFYTGVMTRSETEYDSYVIGNLSYGYDAGSWGDIRIGANNVTDEDPVFDPTRNVAATISLYDYVGRVVFVEYRNTFNWF